MRHSAPDSIVSRQVKKHFHQQGRAHAQGHFIFLSFVKCFSLDWNSAHGQRQSNIDSRIFLGKVWQPYTGNKSPEIRITTFAFAVRIKSGFFVSWPDNL